MSISPSPRDHGLEALQSYFVRGVGVEWEAGRAPHEAGWAWFWGWGSKCAPTASQVRAWAVAQVTRAQRKPHDLDGNNRWPEGNRRLESSSHPLSHSAHLSQARPEIYGDFTNTKKTQDGDRKGAGEEDDVLLTSP